MCGLNETNKVNGTPEDRGYSEEASPVSLDGCMEKSKRATAIWWLAALLQHTVDSKVDEPTLRVTVIPAARHILGGLQ